MQRYFVFVSAAMLGMLLVSGAWAQTNYAEGQPYTAEPPLRTDWLGDTDNSELTDGDKTWGWDPVTGWVGDVANPKDIVVDLGEVKSDIGKVVVTVFVSAGSAVSTQKQVLVSVSSTSDSEGFAEVGEATTEETGAETNHPHVWEGDASGRWVKITLDAEAPGWHTLLSEIEVFASEGTSAVDEWSLYE